MIEAILCDIEGTTTSLSFVKDILFPYAEEHLPDFVLANLDHPEVKQAMNEVKVMMNNMHADHKQIIEQLLVWIKQDKKLTPLKTIQGLIWENGYSSGAYEGHVYEDAFNKLIQWHKNGIKLYIFSSGSIQAQKLLFSHSIFGDLTKVFSGYFDTTTGPKSSRESYEAIARKIAVPANHILFLSDIEAELDAAMSAGMQTVCLVRQGKPKPDINHIQVFNFDDISVS